MRGMILAKVTIKGLTKRFGKVEALKDVSLEANDKEFLVLLGPSGCGKTTLLRCLAGLETPDEGQIFIDDKLVNNLPPKKRDVAMVFQSYALYPQMTVYDNISFPLRIRETPRAEIERSVKETAEMLRITDLLDRKPKQLSGGQAQRVALGRAVVRKPKVFLMDEPLSNLDAKLRVYMRAELKELQKELEITTIYVTHDQVEAMTMADRVALLNQGLLQQVDTPQDLYAHPTNTFVAGFVGNPPMNLADCRLLKEADSLFLTVGKSKIRLSERWKKALANRKSGDELVLGVRPEDMEVSTEQEENAISGEMLAVEPLGSEIIVNAKVDDSIFRTRQRPEFKVGTGLIWMSFGADKIHLFDKETSIGILPEKPKKAS
jgi:multiple sugar transport system ATP-binding protein